MNRIPALSAIMLYTIGYWVFRLPFIILTPFVRFDPDSFQYANVAYRMSLGQWPDFGFLPPVYPVFLRLTEMLGMSAWQVVQLQMLLGYLSGAALIYALSKWSAWSGVVAALALFWYNGTFRAIVYQDASLLTESLYVSSLMLLVAWLLDAFRSGTRTRWALFSVVLTVPLLLRPNGIVLLAWGLLPVVILLATGRKDSVKWAVGPAAVIMLLFASYGLTVSGSAVPFRLKMLFAGRASKDVTEAERKTMLWEGAVFDESIWYRDGEVLADSSHQNSTSMVHKVLIRVPEFVAQPLSSGDLAYRGLVHGGAVEMNQLLPPYADKDSAYWLSQSGYPIPPPLVRYTVREYWQQGVPDFQEMRYRHEGTFKGALVNYMLRFSGMMHKAHGMVTSTLPFFVLAAVSWGLLLITGWRRHLKLHIALLLLAALLSLDALAVMAGAGRMLERYTFPPVFIAMVIFALSLGGLVSQCVAWSGRRRQ